MRALSRPFGGLALLALGGALLAGGLLFLRPQRPIEFPPEPPPPPLPHTVEAREAKAILQRLAVPNVNGFEPRQTAALLAAARRLQAIPPEELRTTIAYLTDHRREFEDGTRVFLALRAMFELPEDKWDHPLGGFDAWVRPEHSTFSWPLIVKDGAITGVAGMFFYGGPPYMGLKEYDYFRKTFPFRKLPKE